MKVNPRDDHLDPEKNNNNNNVRNIVPVNGGHSSATHRKEKMVKWRWIHGLYNMYFLMSGWETHLHLNRQWVRTTSNGQNINLIKLKITTGLAAICQRYDLTFYLETQRLHNFLNQALSLIQLA